MGVKRTNPNGLTVLAKRMASLDTKEARAGWFESAVYEDGTPIAYVASIQEYGATINHPGGTPYVIGKDGKATFVRKDSPGAASLPVTKAHVIVIPPRPFMRPTIAEKQREWLNLMASGAKAVLAGNSSPHDVMEAVGARAAADVAKTIASITEPELAASTIAKRRNAMANKKLVGSLDKPLIASGLMFDTLTNTVEDR